MYCDLKLGFQSAMAFLVEPLEQNAFILMYTIHEHKRIFIIVIEYFIKTNLNLQSVEVQLVWISQWHFRTCCNTDHFPHIEFIYQISYKKEHRQRGVVIAHLYTGKVPSWLLATQQTYGLSYVSSYFIIFWPQLLALGINLQGLTALS